MTHRIKELREENGWTQAQLAVMCGTSQQAIQRYEAGVREPVTSVIAKLSSVFGVTISYLLGIDDDPNPHGAVLTDDEQQLISFYRSADDRGKANIMATASREAM